MYSFAYTGISSDPEVYPRPDGTVYLCGFSDSVPLPESADLVEPNKDAIEGLLKLGRNISTGLAGLTSV